MSDALEEHDGKVSIGGKNITDLRFADDIDALAEEEQELEALVESLDKTCTRYKMKFPRQVSSTLEQLFQMMAPYQRFSQGLHKPLQLLTKLKPI